MPRNNKKKRAPQMTRRDLAHWLAAEGSVDEAEKIKLAQAISGDEPPRKPKPTAEPHPDWLASKFEAHDDRQQRGSLAALRRGYLLLYVISGGFVVTLIVVAAAWATR